MKLDTARDDSSRKLGHDTARRAYFKVDAELRDLDECAGVARQVPQKISMFNALASILLDEGARIGDILRELLGHMYVTQEGDVEDAGKVCR